MKVCWKYDSLRLRITPTELEDLLGGAQISERFDLSDGPVWEVAICLNAEETSLRNFGDWIQAPVRQNTKRGAAKAHGELQYRAN